MRLTLNNFLEYNIPKEFVGIERVRIKLVSVYTFITLVGTLFDVTYWAIDGRSTHLLFNGLLSLFPITSMILIYFREVKIAHFIMFYLFPFLGFNTFAYLYGNLGTENYFIVILVMFIFIEDNRWKNILYGICVVAALLVNKLIYRYTTPISSEFEDVGDQLYYINMLVGSISIIIFLLAFKSELSQKDRRIAKVHGELEDQYHKEVKHKKFILELSEELNHRVKNNLQIVSSLIRIDVSRCETEEAVEALNSVQRKILNLSVLHKHLHQTDKVMYVDLLSYIGELMDQVQISLGVDFKVDIEAPSKGLRLDSGKASNIGLVLNELLVNSIKYNSESRDLQVYLKIEKSSSDKLSILFKDNGVGFKDIDNISNGSFGLGFIKNLCCYNGGSMHIYNKNGANIEITL